jgi:dTDP-4-dehydrorhamnose reductase
VDAPHRRPRAGPGVVSLDPEDRAVERIRQGSRHEPTRWFHDETRQPAMASDIAAALWQIASLEPGPRAGVWQLPGPEHLSRYEIARRVVDTLRLDPGSVAPVPVPPDAGRPRHIDMVGGRARGGIGWDPAPVLVRDDRRRRT